MAHEREHEDLHGPSQYVEAGRGSGPVFANQNGRQSIYINSMKNHLQEGLMALKGKIYAKAVTEFENSLSDASKAGAENLPEAAHDLALGHFAAALALLGGRPPGDRVPEEIYRVENHLERAISYGEPVITHQAKVLWALVKDDYYTAHGMAVRPPSADVLAESVHALGASELEPLLTHLPHVRGKTWQFLSEHATQFGMRPSAEPAAAPVVRQFDPRRRELVRKYFIPTPPERSAAVHGSLLGGAALLVVIGLALQNAGTLLFLAGAFFLIRAGWRKYGDYRRYLKRRDEALPKPSDAQMDAWLVEDVEVLSSKASDQVGLNPKLVQEGGDLVYPAQIVVGVPTDTTQTRLLRGADKKLRADHYDVLTLFLTDNHISVYRCLIDFHTGEPILETVTERHYRDIVGVTSNRVPVPAHIVDLFKQLDKLIEENGGEVAEDEKYAGLSFRQTFALSIISGETFEMSTGFGNATNGTDEIAWGKNGPALDIIKKMVRARHSAR